MVLERQLEFDFMKERSFEQGFRFNTYSLFYVQNLVACGCMLDIFLSKDSYNAAGFLDDSYVIFMGAFGSHKLYSHLKYFFYS